MKSLFNSIFMERDPLTEQEMEEMNAIRDNSDNNFYDHKSVEICDAPVMKVSASFIRKSIQKGKAVKYLLTEKVHAYVEEMHFYKEKS